MVAVTLGIPSVIASLIRWSFAFVHFSPSINAACIGLQPGSIDLPFSSHFWVVSPQLMKTRFLCQANATFGSFICGNIVRIGTVQVVPEDSGTPVRECHAAVANLRQRFMPLTLVKTFSSHEQVFGTTAATYHTGFHLAWFRLGCLHRRSSKTSVWSSHFE